MDRDDIPEPDCQPGAPHPRFAERLLGQGEAEATFLDAYQSGRLHHAWLLAGPKGIGKATLAWRLARFLLATPAAESGGFLEPEMPDTLDVSPDHPVARRLRALSEPGLFLLRRPWDEKAKRLRVDITAEPTRRLRSFFAQTMAEGGRRVVIVDAADEMNPTAANAVLKVLEEPPRGAVFLLVCHRPAAILPTIRSRCRLLSCAPLAPDDLAAALDQAGIAVPEGQGEALAVLSGGSAGASVRLIAGGGLDSYAAFWSLLATAPGLDRRAARRFADAAAARDDPGRLAQTLDLIEIALSRLARAGAMGPPHADLVPGEGATAVRLAPDLAAARRWAALAAEILPRARRGAATNLDPALLVLDITLRIDAVAAEVAAGTAPAA